MKKPILLNLSARHMDDTNQIVDKLVVKHDDERPIKIVDYVKKLHKAGNSVLLIDERLTTHKAYYLATLPPETIFVVGWNDARRYKECNSLLAKIRGQLSTIVVTDLSGSRGQDYQFRSKVRVVISLQQLKYNRLLQCLGRGSRRNDVAAEGTIVLDAKDDIDDLKELQKVLLYKRQELYQDDLVKRKIIQHIHDKVLNLDAVTKHRLLGIMNGDERVYYEIDAIDDDAARNWTFLKETLKSAMRLTGTPKELKVV